MLGLVKKDLLMIKSNFKLLTILLFIYGVMALEGYMELTFLLPFMSIMIMMSTFSYDNYNKSDAYQVVFPNGRKNSVRAKYLSTLLLVVVTTAIVVVLSILISFIKGGVVDYEGILSSILGAILAIVILMSIMYPSIYKFGVERARVGIFVLVFGVSIIGALVVRNFKLSVLESIFDFSKVINFMNDYWAVLLIIFICSILYVSYKVSERIIMNKEF